MTHLKWFTGVVLAVTGAATLTAEVGCPGNVASLPFRLVNRHQMVVSVSINRGTAHDFLLDTGTQMTMVDPALASELHLETTRKVAVGSVGVVASAYLAQVDQIGAGTHTLADRKVLVYDLKNLPAVGMAVRGVLGEDFLEHFDMLIDNGHHLVCLDDGSVLRAEVKGPHIPLVDATHGAESDVAASLIVTVRLTDGMRPVRLKLDSGSNVPFLWNSSEYMALGLRRNVSFHGSANGTLHSFAALPPQTMKIGRLEVDHVAFVAALDQSSGARTSGCDGLLTLGVFRTVFFNHAEHSVVLVAW